MRKILKKAMVALMALGLLFSSAYQAFAADNAMEFNGAKTVSEYDYFKSAKKLSKAKLLEKGYTAKQIEDIKSFDYDEYVKQMKESTDEELKERGLTDEAISIVRNSNDIDVILYATMGRVEYKISKVSFTYSGGITYLTTKATWSWSARPLQEWVDIIGAGTSENFKKVSGKTVITYYKGGKKSAKSYTKEVALKTQNSGTNVYSEIYMKDADFSDINNPVMYYAMAGTCTTKWSVSGDKKTVGISCKYGHATISCTPSIGVSRGGIGFSFTPSYAISEGEEDYHSVNRT